MKQRRGKQQKKLKRAKKFLKKRPTKLTNLQLKEREKTQTQITNIRNEKSDITIYLTEIEKTIEKYREPQCQQDNQDEMDKILKRYKLLKLTQERMKILIDL